MASIRSIRSSSERTSSRYTLWKPEPSFLSTIRCSNKLRGGADAVRHGVAERRCCIGQKFHAPSGIKQRDPLNSKS